MITSLTLLILSLAALYIGAGWLVQGSSALALKAKISPLVIGLTIVAFGTSAPELVVSLNATLRGQGDIAIGNIVGSNIFNIGVILGVSATICPLQVKNIAPNRYPGHAGRNRTAHHPFLERDIGPDRRTFLSDRYHHLYIIQPVPLPQAWRRRAEPGARRTTGALDCRYAGHRRGAGRIGFCFPIIGGQCDFHCRKNSG